MSIVVTGAAGFVGSNIVRALNERGITDIIAVDHLLRGEKFHNLVDCDIAHYIDKQDFIQTLNAGKFDGRLQVIIHQGACSDTMNHDGLYMMENNYSYTLTLFDYCQRVALPFLYASSAAVYGKGTTFFEAREYEAPLNVYGYSKFLFDQLVRRRMAKKLTAQVVGLRYFNVYGPREQHKDRMASVAFHHYHQYITEGKVKLFGAWDGWGNGMQSRDFISVEDVVKINLFFLDHPEKSGIFNVGTGRAQPFNDVAISVVNGCRQHEGKPPLTGTEMIDQSIIEYLPFPDALKGKYQSFTQADISALRAAGYQQPMLSVQQGVERYIHWLASRT